MNTPLLIENLTVHIPVPEGTVRAVDGVSLALNKGEILAIVGESGSGKTITARSIVGLLPANAVVNGAVILNGHDVLTAKPAALRKI